MFAVAFFQWRLKHPNILKHDPEELEELIVERSKRLLITKSIPDFSVENPKNTLTTEIIRKYNLNEGQYDFTVNSFERVGLADPFPNDEDEADRESDLARNAKILEDPLQVPIYPDWKAYDPSMTPLQIFIPSKALMFKLMRSCIDVKLPQDLWINV